MDFEYEKYKEDSTKLMDFLYSNTIHIFKAYEKSGKMGLHLNSTHLPDDLTTGLTSQDVVEAVLKQNDDNLIHKYILVEFARSLVYDACNNFYEAIWAIRRDNYRIAFQLIRKPLEETILHLEAIAADTNNYIEYFKNGDPNKLYLSNYYKGEKLFSLIENVCHSIRVKLNIELLVNSEAICKLRYDKGSKAGFYLYNQKSIHVITSRSPLYASEPYSLNTVGFDDVPMKLLLTNLPFLLDYFRNLVLLVFSSFSHPDAVVPFYKFGNARRAAGFFSFYKPILGSNLSVSFTPKMINELNLQCVSCGNVLNFDQELSEIELIDFYYNGNLPNCCSS
jgi:hypothetical protein